jgi:hypothetical protein
VVHGWSLPPYFADGAAPDQVLNEELAHAETSAIESALAPWREKFSGVEVIEQNAIGNAGSHLVDAAADASLVVVGRRIGTLRSAPASGLSPTLCCTTPRRRSR